ncbi:hypothetical protein F2Q68_00011087 [Brassica cretica]|uniref:Uncharacterized protein n=1 Tax=Brassica cretica TaxID=69181 RepID=A0A8S9KQP7_BRACR|nr:hypothetical protein F2Q68_00011087 [Brassica cretica]
MARLHQRWSHRGRTTETKNGKSWSKSKDKKKNSNEKKEEDSPPTDDGDQSHHDEESISDEEKPKSRRKIFTIRATPSHAPSTTAKPEDDLCQSLNQKSMQTIESLTSTDNTLMEVDGAPPRISCSVGKLNASDARHILDSKRKDPFHRQVELKREMWSNNQSDGIETTDLRVKLNSKIPDLREKLKRCKTDRSKAEPEPIVLYQRKTQDLRMCLDSLRAEQITRSEKEHQEKFQRLNGGSSHDHIQALKLLLMLFLGSRRSLGPEGVETRTQVLSLALIQDDRLWLHFGAVGLASFEFFAKIQDLRGELNSEISRLDTIRLIDVSSVGSIELSYVATDPRQCAIDFHKRAVGGSEAFDRLH